MSAQLCPDPAVVVQDTTRRLCQDLVLTHVERSSLDGSSAAAFQHSTRFSHKLGQLLSHMTQQLRTKQRYLLVHG